MLEKATSIKRFEYSPSGKELKVPTDIAKDHYKFFKDWKNNVIDNREARKNDEVTSDEDKSDESKAVKKFDAIWKDNIGRISKLINVKSRGSNINLHPLILKLLNAEKIVLKKD